MVNKFKAGRNLTHVFDEQMDNETEREPFKAAYNTADAQCGTTEFCKTASFVMNWNQIGKN